MAPNVSRIFARSGSKRKPSTDESIGHREVLRRDDSTSSSLQSPNFSTPHLISTLYSDAGKFEKILLQSGCITPQFQDAPLVTEEGDTGFLDLVAHDLDKKERALVDRDARIFATNKSWTPGSSDFEENIFSDNEDEEGKSSATSSSSDLSEPPIPAIHRAWTIDSQSLDLLEPSDIVNILIEEFGPLAGPGEEEKLLLETDGCLLHDVAIVGVIHLTTHRLTFHASLLSTRPDLESQDAIKAGPATMHRKGWRNKHRVWLELTHDMICAYSSSQDDDRTRPVSTLLLSSVLTVLPLDKSSPKTLHLSVDPSIQTFNDYVEFDTEESASEWRRELTGAIFNYRHLRRETYTTTSSESSGVRFNCPLTQIVSLKWAHELLFSSVVSLTVQLSASDFQFENESLPESQVFEIGPVEAIPIWNRLDEIVMDAKAQQSKKDSQVTSTVVVDFGPYNFFETDRTPINTPNHISVKGELAVRFALGFKPEIAVWIARARIHRTISCSGYFAISDDHLGFWCKNITQRDLRYRLPIASIGSVKPFSLNWLSTEGMSINIDGKPSVNFVFRTALIRDQAVKKLNSFISSRQPTKFIDGSITDSPLPINQISILTGPLSPTKVDPIRLLAPLSRSLAAATAVSCELPHSTRTQLPKVLNFPKEFLVAKKSLHFICLTIGSRGDVQPYIALGLGLLKEGHKVTIVTHEEYKPWIVGFGLQHRTAGGDPGALMKLSVENKMFSPEFFRQSLINFRPWLDQLLLESWEACRDADVLLESPSAMAGVHIAESLNIPYFRTFTMPWTKTNEFPHAFLSPPVESPTFNSASYILFSNVMWAATSGQINKWRRHSLGLGNTDMGHLAQSKITFIYNFSKAVVPKPLDWPDTTIVSGYWFLDNPDLGWVPPQDLVDWMDKARADGKPIVYIGFGSITVPRPNKVTAAIVKAVLKSGVRAIISKGWSARMSKPDDKDPPPVVPAECFLLEKVPHDWLFPRIDAALHHGGAGTTGASLRAGLPTIIKPWFGDQFFWASRVQVLGAGVKVGSLRSSELSAALIKATQDSAMKAKAAAVGELIRKEDGIHTAIYTIYTYLHRASQARSSLV